MVRRALRSLLENLWLNLVATGVIAAAVMLAGVYASVLVNLDRTVDSWDRDVHISAYFYADVPVDRRFAVKDELAARAEVRQVDYVSEEAAAEFLVGKVEDVGPILEELGDDVLPASLEITLNDAATAPEDIAVFVETIHGPDFEVIDYGQEWVQRFNTFLALLRAMGIVLGALIMTAAIFLVANTMHLVAYARRQELETMKLVGSTWNFVAIPFALEGALQGIIGSGVALAAVYTLHRLLVLQLESALSFTLAEDTLIFMPPLTVLGLFAGGIALGVVGCLAAIRRFWTAAP
jgi:cell division transport system permease protein